MDKKATAKKGILLINKPKDFTSFDVVALMRGLLHEKRVGHTGTLDPMATGVLPILVGKATVAESLLPDTNKEYIANFQFGFNTDTQDITGKEVAKFDKIITKDEVVNILPKFSGKIMQVPPMYSALKVDGVKLCDLARKGIVIDRQAREIFIDYIDLIEFDEQKQLGSFKVSCSKGTYIRTLIEDIATMGNSGGVMTELCRSKACSFELDDCITIEQAREMSKNDSLTDRIIAVDKIFDVYKSCKVSDKQSLRFKNGGALAISRLKIKDCVQDEIFRMYDNDDNFMGLGKVDKNIAENSIDEFGEMKILKQF